MQPQPHKNLQEHCCYMRLSTNGTHVALLLQGATLTAVLTSKTEPIAILQYLSGILQARHRGRLGDIVHTTCSTMSTKGQNCYLC